MFTRLDVMLMSISWESEVKVKSSSKMAKKEGFPHALMGNCAKARAWA